MGEVTYGNFGKLETQIKSMPHIIIELKQEKNFRRLSKSQVKILETAEQMVLCGEDWDWIGILYYWILYRVLKSLDETLYQRMMTMFHGS